MTLCAAPGTLHRDRRVWMGAVAGLATLALVGVGALAVAVATRPEPAIAEMADHARLSVVADASPRRAVPETQDKLATLGPAQLADQERPLEPVDPALQVVLNQERQERAQALAEQRAFDARLKGELNDNTVPAETATPTPARSAPNTSTSNTEDATS